MSINTANLLELAEILDTADEKHLAKGEPTYIQDYASHKCGTPACALGHWVATKHPALYTDSRWTWHKMMEQDFGLQRYDAEIIFGSRGCDSAKKAKEAAKFIRNFVDGIKK